MHRAIALALFRVVVVAGSRGSTKWIERQQQYIDFLCLLGEEDDWR
jgi:hypothetical protein